MRTRQRPRRRIDEPFETFSSTDGYSVLCGGHAFLSDGRLLVVGGGYGHNAKARWAYIFDPVSVVLASDGAMVAGYLSNPAAAQATLVHAIESVLQQSRAPENIDNPR